MDSTSRHALANWYRQSPVGRRLRDQVAGELAMVLDEWFGYHLLILGADADIDVASLTRVQQVTRIIPEGERWAQSDRIPAEQQRFTEHLIVADDEDLPVETESVDVVVLLNGLELSSTPHKVLREVHRVLVPNGHLVVLGSNPLSLRGCWRGLRDLFGMPGSRRSGPGAGKLEDWLHLLHFSVATPRHKLVLPVGSQGRLGRFVGRVDNWLAEHNIPPGSAYLLWANKMVGGYVGNRPTARTSARLIGIPVAKPVVGARGSASHNPTSTRDYPRLID